MLPRERTKKVCRELWNLFQYQPGHRCEGTTQHWRKNFQKGSCNIFQSKQRAKDTFFSPLQWKINHTLGLDRALKSNENLNSNQNLYANLIEYFNFNINMYKQLKYPSTGQWVNWFFHRMEYYSAVIKEGNIVTINNMAES